MTPEKCSFCKGKLKYGKTDFTARVGDEIVTVKNVPAYICEHCDEAYFTPDVSRKIDRTMRDVQRGKLYAHPVAAGELEYESELD